MEMAKVTSKGQITIPISIRRKLSINEGDKLLFIERPDGFMLVNPNTFETEHDDDSSEFADTTAGYTRTIVDSSLETSISNSPGSISASNKNNQSTSKGFDAAALLNEIRSIGSKI
jgi:AbrB family looped-hinge helix DNA binding protein